MYDMIRRNIEAGGYDLRYMIGQIDQFWLERSINSAERDSLIALAREHANPEDSYAPIEQRMSNLESIVRALEDRVAALEEGGSGGGDDGGDTPTPTDEWPEFVQPTGAHDAYQSGDKVTYKGRRYICQMDGCVWAPDTYPAAWQDAGAAPEPEPEVEPSGE